MLKTTTEKKFDTLYKLYMMSIISLCLIGVVITIPACTVDKVYSDAIRLHIIANSDQEIDQSVKLKVRDEILKTYAQNLQDIKDDELCYEYVTQNKVLIQDVALNTLKANGFSYGAKVDIGKYVFPTRMYESATLPAGEYRSVKIILGDGMGKNWWCVIYPPMCVDLDEVSTDEINEIINGKTKSETIVFRSILLEKLGIDTPQPSKKAIDRLLKWMNQK